MDMIDNAHFERVQEFVGTEDLEIKLSRNGLRELPWVMGLYRFHADGVDLLYDAHSMTFSGVLKLVSLWVMNQEAHGINAVDPVPPNLGFDETQGRFKVAKPDIHQTSKHKAKAELMKQAWLGSPVAGVYEEAVDETESAWNPGKTFEPDEDRN